MKRPKISTDSYRTEGYEWVIGLGLYRNRARQQWVLNVELGRRVLTVCLETA